MNGVTWQNSTLIKGNVADEVARLRKEPGRDIGVHGSAKLVRSLLRYNLLDELKLAVFPVIAGEGERLFEDFDRVQRMQLVNVEQTGKGVVLLTYQQRPA
ncbi:MAG: dihydrofolate reductase family protein [Acidimicrobiia bacterium]